ncbi:hypothetical protein E4U54_001393, partial [Claviceps lovelessii]
MRRKPVPQPLTLSSSAASNSSSSINAHASGTPGSTPGTSGTSGTATRTEVRLDSRSPHISQHSLISPPVQNSPSAPALTPSRFAAGRQQPQTSTAQAGTAHTAQAGTGLVPQTVLHPGRPPGHSPAHHPPGQPGPSPAASDWPSISPNTAHPPSQLHHHPHHLRHPLPHPLTLPLHPPHQHSRDNTSPAFCPPPVPSPCYDQATAPVSPASASASRHAVAPGGRRPGTRSGFFHFSKPSSKGFGQLHVPTSSHPDTRQLALSADPDGSSAPKSG